MTEYSGKCTRQFAQYKKNELESKGEVNYER